MILRILLVSDEQYIRFMVRRPLQYPPRLFFSSCNKSLALLCSKAVDPQVAAEAAEVFWGQNTFLIRRACDLGKFLSFSYCKKNHLGFACDQSENDEEGSLDEDVEHFAGTQGGATSMIQQFLRKVIVVLEIENRDYDCEFLYDLAEWRREYSTVLETLPRLQDIELRFWVADFSRWTDARNGKGCDAYFSATEPVLPIVQRLRNQGKLVKTVISYKRNPDHEIQGLDADSDLDEEEEEIQDIAMFFTRTITRISTNLANISPLLTESYLSRLRYYSKNLLITSKSCPSTQGLVTVYEKDRTVHCGPPEAISDSSLDLLKPWLVGQEVADEATHYFYSSNTFLVESTMLVRFLHGQLVPLESPSKYITSLIITVDTATTAERLRVPTDLPSLHYLEIRLLDSNYRSSQRMNILAEASLVFKAIRDLRTDTDARIMVKYGQDPSRQDGHNNKMLDISDYFDEPAVQYQKILDGEWGGTIPSWSAFHRAALPLFLKKQKALEDLQGKISRLKRYTI
ncbi:MAG: hypothetical protein M1836_004365 [Candelina mexicana]|nr:MAG: hypothetical protein M1836_004365 [Candelina mexicana]